MRNFALVCLIAVFATSSTARAQVIRANDFLNSLGVATKITQGQDSVEAVVAGLKYTGIRNIRDDATHSPGLYATYCRVHGKTGVMVDLLPIVDADLNNITDTITEYEAIAACGAMLQAEGPNEPNNFSFTYKGVRCGGNATTWKACAAYQKDLYSAVHGDPKLAGMQVLAQTEPGSEADNQGLQFLTIPGGAGALQPDDTHYADAANLHNYVKGNGASGKLSDNQAWGAEWTGSGLGGWDGLDGNYIHQTWRGHFAALPAAKGPELPKQTTETGWETGSCPACITQDQQGKLYINVLFSAAKLYWSRTFFYQMFDQTADGSTFGIFSDKSPTPKLSARYIHNLSAILQDNSSSFTPQAVSYSIAGETNTIHDVLLQKSNGTYELAVWGDRPVSGETTPVTVRLPNAYPTVRVYDVTKGASPVQTYSNVSTIPLVITDHACLIEYNVQAASRRLRRRMRARMQ